MTSHRMHVTYRIDANGCLTETREVGDHIVVIHFDDLPETDVTTIDGIHCTTALRTVIDIAPQYLPNELDELISHWPARNLFTVSEAMQRIAQPDMAGRPGAITLGKALQARGDAAG